MGSKIPDPLQLYIETPCIPSPELSRIAGCNIFLKLDNLQPSGSFKSRGIGHLMARHLSHSRTGHAHFYCSSGGNAGLACAEAARTLRQPCDVFVTHQTPAHVLDKLSALGATPHRVGTSWPEADAQCQLSVKQDKEGVYVPPFDDPLIWTGHASLVDELYALEKKGFFPSSPNPTTNLSPTKGHIDAIVCNVGGGGLLNGIIEGIERNYDSLSDDRPVVLALETDGADSLAATIRAGKLVTLPAITSIASSLGAPQVSPQTYIWVREYDAVTFRSDDVVVPPPPETTGLISVVVSDAQAVAACAKFVDDARMLVEVACGATLSSAYEGGKVLRTALGQGMDDESWSRMNVVLVVCGGSNISMEMLARYREKFGV